MLKYKGCKLNDRTQPFPLKEKRKFTVAVEGNIGCGKTTFLQHFEDKKNVEVTSIVFFSVKIKQLQVHYKIRLISYSFKKNQLKCGRILKVTIRWTLCIKILNDGV